MAITERARQDLLVEISPHAEANGGERLPNGLIKTRRGLIIPPSTIGNGEDTKSGKLAELTAYEKSICGITDQPAPVPASITAVTTGSKRSRKQAASPAAPATAQPVLVQLILPNIGTVPSQYAHCIQGNGIIVLGMNEYSYMPAPAVMTESGMAGTVQFSNIPGVNYVFMGYEFRDNNGIRNIIMVRVPDNNQEDYEDDGQE